VIRPRRQMCVLVRLSDFEDEVSAHGFPGRSLVPGFNGKAGGAIIIGRAKAVSEPSQRLVQPNHRKRTSRWGTTSASNAFEFSTSPPTVER
jgi:hypothetical protein